MGIGQGLPSFFLGPRRTRARNFRAFGDGGFHEAGGFHSGRFLRFAGGALGASQEKSLPVNQNGGKITLR